MSEKLVMVLVGYSVQLIYI